MGRRGRLLTGAAIVLIFLSFFENGLTILSGVKLRLIGFLILSWLFGGSVYAHLFRRGPALRGYEKAMLAWFGTGLLSALYDMRFGLEGGMVYLLAYNLLFEYGWIMAYFAGKHAAARGADFGVIFRWTVGFGIVVTGFAIVEKFTHTYIELFLLATGNPYVTENFDQIFRRGYGYDESAYRCVSFVLEFIAFSYLCGVLAVTFLVRAVEARKPAYLIAFVSALAALSLTQSLSSLFACIAAILVYLFIVKKMRAAYLFWAGVAGLALVAVVSLAKEEDAHPFAGIQRRLEGVMTGEDHGLITHFQDFKFGVIQNFSLIGHGIGTGDFLHVGLGAEMRQRGYPSIEHEYFRILFEFGGVGFLFYLAAVFLSARGALALYREARDPFRKSLAMVCCLWFLIYFLVGFAHRSFPTYASSVFPGLFLGWLAATRGTDRARPEGKPA